MLAAKLAQIAFSIVAVKFITKRTGAKRLDALLIKIHRLTAHVLLGAGMIHMVLLFRNISKTPIMVYNLGIIGILSIIAAIAVSDL